MPNSLLEQLPRIIVDGRQEAGRMLERFNSRKDASLQTREWVFPATALESPNVRLDARQWIPPNRLIHGDSLSAAAALLAGDAHWPSLRGRIGLILIDPQLDAGGACSNDSSGGIASYLSMITPRLALMRELLSPSGSIYIRLNAAATPYVGTVVGQLFGHSNPVHAFAGGAEQPSGAMLAAIILVSSDPHTIVADFLGGSGRTAVAAAQYGRHWIAADGSNAACLTMRRRLREHSNEPFLYQAIG